MRGWRRNLLKQTKLIKINIGICYLREHYVEYFVKYIVLVFIKYIIHDFFVGYVCLCVFNKSTWLHFVSLNWDSFRVSEVLLTTRCIITKKKSLQYKTV